MLKRATMAVLLLTGSVAVAQEDATPVPAAAVAPLPSQSMGDEQRRFGLQIDVGAPAGATAAFLFRPWSFARFNAGVGYDALSFGVKGGVTLIPFHWGVVPTLGLEAGHYFAGDLTKLATISDPLVATLVKQVGYDYVSADLGLEFGSQNRFVFYIRAGVTQIWPSVANFQEALRQANAGSTLRITATDPALSARSPAARFGFILYLF